jgi:hypothetical protein
MDGLARLRTILVESGKRHVSFSAAEIRSLDLPLDPDWWTRPLRPWRTYPRHWSRLHLNATPSIRSGEIHSVDFHYEPSLRIGNWPLKTVLGLAAIGATIGMLFIWIVPALVIRSDEGLSPYEVENARAALRTTLVALGAVTGALVTVVVTVRSYSLTREAQVTDRLSKTWDQLGSSNINVRLGAITSLRRIADDSARDRHDIVAALCSFVLEHGSRELPESGARNPRQRPDVREAASGYSPSPPPDVEAALDGAITLSRDLHALTLQLNRAQIPGARIAYRDLSGANLAGINLVNSFAMDARLDGAFLMFADLRGSWLTGASLRGAYLYRADLSGADLADADLTGAELVEADLTDVSGLTRSQLDAARDAGARLPTDLR